MRWPEKEMTSNPVADDGGRAHYILFIEIVSDFQQTAIHAFLNQHFYCVISLGKNLPATSGHYITSL